MPFISKSTGIPTVDKVFKEVFAILNRFQGGKVASSSGEPVSWFDIINKPLVFPPESHTQDISTINNLQTALDSKEPVIALGTGNKYLFRDKTWKEIDWSEIVNKPSSFTPSAHTHLWSEISDKPSVFTPSAHSHAIADITNLQAALDDKQPVHANLTSISNLSTTPSGRFLVTNGSAIVARSLQNSDLPAIAITDTFVVNSQAAMLALSAAERGDVAVRTDLNKSFILKGDNPASLSDWQELLTPTDAVLSVDGRTGVVSLSDKYQPLDADLTAIAGLSHTNRHVMISNGTSWTRRALEEADLPSLSAAKITSGTLDNARLSFNPDYFVQGTNNRRMILSNSTSPLVSNEFCTFFRMDNTDPSFDSRLTGGVGLGFKVINNSGPYSFELMGQASGNGVLLFGGADHAGERYPWRSIWHSGNFNPADFSLTTHNHDALYAALSHNHSAAHITSGTLSVSRGGTGASTLTGYLKGNGTSAFSAVASIPWADLSGVPDTFTPSTHNHNRLIGIVDTRNVATTPNDYPRSVIPQFKTNTAIGLSAGGTYSTTLGVFGWTDPSGGHAHELAFNSSGIYNRIGPPGSSWGNWKRLLTTEDISTTVAPATHNHGTGTTNYIPLFTNGATGAIGNSQLSQSANEVTASKGFTSIDYLLSEGPLYTKNNIYLINKAGNAWLNFATRDVSGSEAVVDLSNVRSISMKSPSANNTMRLFAESSRSAAGINAETGVLEIRNTSTATTGDILIQSVTSDINISSQGESGEISLDAKRVKISRRNLKSQTFTYTENGGYIIDLNNYYDVNLFIINSTADWVSIGFKNATVGDEIHVNIKGYGGTMYQRDPHSENAWYVYPNDAIKLDEFFYKLICTGTDNYYGQTINTWIIGS